MVDNLLTQKEVRNTAGNKRNQPIVIILAPDQAKPQKLTGEQWEMITEAIEMAMKQVDIEERKRTGKSVIRRKIDDKGILEVDCYAPESFSYLENALIALFAGGRKTATEIAEYIVEKRLGKKMKKRKQ